MLMGPRFEIEPQSLEEQLEHGTPVLEKDIRPIPAGHLGKVDSPKGQAGEKVDHAVGKRLRLQPAHGGGDSGGII